MKNIRARKIQLNREVLKNLSTKQMHGVAGGATFTTCNRGISDDPSNCSSCQ